MLISTAPGTQHFERTLNRALERLPEPEHPEPRRSSWPSEQKSVNQLLGLIYVLLALAVLIALIGIVNTLMLSVFERTHEIGLLRAVGMQRPQVKWMVRSESVIIALFGAVVGIVVGTGLGLALAGSLRNNGVTALSVPIGSLIVFLILSALLGTRRRQLAGPARGQARRAAGDRRRVSPRSTREQHPAAEPEPEARVAAQQLRLGLSQHGCRAPRRSGAGPPRGS